MKQSNILTKAYLSFAKFYVISLISVGVVTALLDLPNKSFLHFAVLAVSVYGTAFEFFKKNGRVPDKHEHKKLALGSITISLLISCLAVIVLLLLGDDTLFKAEALPIILIVTSVVLLIEYFAVLSLYGTFSKSIERQKKSRG